MASGKADILCSSVTTAMLWLSAFVCLLTMTDTFDTSFARIVFVPPHRPYWNVIAFKIFHYRIPCLARLSFTTPYRSYANPCTCYQSPMPFSDISSAITVFTASPRSYSTFHLLAKHAGCSQGDVIRIHCFHTVNSERLCLLSDCAG